ncbi:hypothetical protein [Actinomadura sp. K4S16]|uniref:hypothetical protein n=1 Tax=Actinomadura sp. K4S16 TaxID=1316147 RepID=UPI0011EEE90A|nr:hypothetical protein [Actinomadura sp. K4S16]
MGKTKAELEAEVEDLTGQLGRARDEADKARKAAEEADTDAAYRRGRADAANEAAEEVARLTGRTGGVLTRAIKAKGE